MDKEQENAFKNAIEQGGALYKYLLSKWWKLILVSICFAVAGVTYAWLQKPIYAAEITFAPENEGSNMGSYATIAAQFGFDMGGSAGGAFEGENLSEFLKSKMMIETTLLTSINSKDTTDVLINYFIKQNQINKDWDKFPDLKGFLFSKNYSHGNRNRDSVLQRISKLIGNNLVIQKKDKKLNIISAKIKDGNELFAKLFIENLVNNGINYYVNYRSGKSRQNVVILQRQADSVYNLLSGGITAVAIGNDLNVNPIKQVVRSGLQRKQVDLQANTRIYEEVLKQLELSKISLRRETPFIQIIDVPVMPLEKSKLGRLKALILFGFLGGIISVLFFTIKFVINHYLKLN